MKIVEKKFHPEYSQPWLGRPFVLGEDFIAWGRYAITLAAVNSKKWSYLKFGVKQTDPGQLASAFEHLIHVYCPDSFPDFLREIQALAAYHHAKENMKTLLRNGCAPQDYYRASIATVGAFDEALWAVFKSSIPLHGLSKLTYVRYRQKLHGMHLTIFSDDEHTYDVAFTRDLVLASIQLDSDWSRIWPQST